MHIGYRHRQQPVFVIVVVIPPAVVPESSVVPDATPPAESRSSEPQFIQLIGETFTRPLNLAWNRLFDRLIGYHPKTGPPLAFAGDTGTPPISPTDPKILVYYHTDHLGSTHLITEGKKYAGKHAGITYPKGTVIQRFEYAAFGHETFALNPNQEFNPSYTGQKYDIETGLYWYRSRYYNPIVARFMQPDTIIPDPTDPQSYNRYTYVANNPLKYTDPSGHILLEFDPSEDEHTVAEDAASLDWTGAPSFASADDIPDGTYGEATVGGTDAFVDRPENWSGGVVNDVVAGGREAREYGGGVDRRGEGSSRDAYSTNVISVGSSVSVDNYVVQQTQISTYSSSSGTTTVGATVTTSQVGSVASHGPYSEFALAVAEGRTGYLDVNVSVGSPAFIGVTGGAIISTSGATYPYAGVGVMTPGPSGSISFSPQQVAPGWTAGGSIGGLVGGQVGIGSDGEWFWESGLFSPSFGITAYYIFESWR